MKKIFGASYFILLILSSLLSFSADYLYQKKGFLYFEGEGDPNVQSDNQTQRRSLAQEAAILVAKAKIAAYIDGLKTKSRNTIKEAREKDNTIEIKVSAFLKGVETVKSTWDDSDHCKVLLRIHKKNLLKTLKAKE